MTQTPPPHNQHAPFGATPSPATVDRLINLNKDDSDDEYGRRNHNRSGAAASSSSATTSAAVRKRSTRTRANSAKSNASNHSNKSNRSGVSVVYAVDANIRIPSSPIVHSPKQNSSNIQESADGKIGAEAAAASSAKGTQKTKPKKKIKVRNAETQTKLSYCGDYEHGRPVLIHHREDPDVYVGKTVAILLMLGIVFDIVVGTVSYYTNWRVREPLLLEFKYQRILQTLYPAALVSGTAIGFGVVIPVLSWVVSGYLESKKHDKYFLFAQILWSVFSGIPMVMVEAMWVGPVTKDEVIYYPPYSLLLSQFALVIHCIVAGASLWYFYLIFCSRKLNDAVQGRRELWIQYQRGIIGSRKCEASRIAIRTAEEIEAKQQGTEMFSINDLLASRMAATTRDGGSARSYEFMAITDEIHQSEDNIKNQQRVGGAITNNNNNYTKKAGDGFSASPLPTGVPPPNKDQTEFSIGGKKFSAVTSAAAGNEAAAELGDENAWGSPLKEEVAVFRSGKHKKKKGKNDNHDDGDGDTSDNGADKNNHNDENRPSASAVDVPPTPAPNNSNKNNKHNKGDRNSPHVNWKADGDEQDDDDADEFLRRRSSVARNVLDDDDPFRS